MPTSHSPSKLVTLLMQAFPNRATFGEECWVADAIEANQWDFGPEIEVVTGAGARQDMVRRLREEHPVRRAHQEEHDDRILSVFSEIAAFAWAMEVARLGVPRFVVEPGSPDLQVGDWWIEAKTIERSAETRARDREERPILRAEGIITRRAVAARPTPAGLMAKFQYQLEDSIRKWERQGRVGRLAIFFNLEKIDFGITRDGTREIVKGWAAESERLSGVAIVVSENWRWQTPLYPEP